MKTCSKCGETKEEKEFYNNFSYCIKCYRKQKKEYHLVYYKLESTKIKREKYFNDEVNKIKIKLRLIGSKTVQNLIKKGLLKNRFECTCSICGGSGKENNIHYHHPDYNYLNRVIPLCDSCHKKLHLNETIFYPKEAFKDIDLTDYPRIGLR